MEGRKRKSFEGPGYHVGVYVRSREPQRVMRYDRGQEGVTMTATRPVASQPRADGKVIGKISSLQRDKSFGFITKAGTGEDYFFHKSEAMAIWDSLQQYDTVVFTPGEGPKGLRATQVERP